MVGKAGTCRSWSASTAFMGHALQSGFVTMSALADREVSNYFRLKSVTDAGPRGANTDPQNLDLCLLSLFELHFRVHLPR